MENDKKYFCTFCKFKTNFPSEWIVHINCKKHKNFGKPKPKICDKCNYECLNHWNLKIHIITHHSIIEERKQQKYYCSDCDRVFFCELYMKKHNESIVHKNKVLADKYARELDIKSI